MKCQNKKFNDKELVKIWISGFAIGFVLATSIASLMLLLMDM